MVMILLLSAFSIYFTGKNIFITRAYFDSYKNYITTGNLKETYRGFNDIEDYILWLDKKIPAKNDLIVALRGDPLYIKAEMGS